jgi:outer membrane cobalamin receptor
MMNVRQWACGLLIVGAILPLASRATAENDDVLTLDEVVVSAERRKRNLIRVPLSITALSDQEVEVPTNFKVVSAPSCSPHVKDIVSIVGSDCLRF